MLVCGFLWGLPVITIQFGQIQDFPFITSPTASFPFSVLSFIGIRARICFSLFDLLLHTLLAFAAFSASNSLWLRCSRRSINFPGKKEEKKRKKWRDLLLEQEWCHSGPTKIFIRLPTVNEKKKSKNLILTNNVTIQPLIYPWNEHWQLSIDANQSGGQSILRTIKAYWMDPSGCWPTKHV